MGDPGATSGTAGVTAGGTGGEPGPGAGGGELARKAGGATKGLATKNPSKLPTCSFLSKASYFFHDLLIYYGFF